MAFLLPTLLTLGPFPPMSAPVLDKPVEIEIRQIVVVVADDGRFDAQFEPREARATSTHSSDTALSDAFAVAEADCDGGIRQMGFDTMPTDEGHTAQLWYRCASPDIAEAIAAR